MQTLEIKKDAAQTAYDNAKNSGKQLLEDLFGKSTFLKDVKERIKTFADVLTELKIDPQDFHNRTYQLDADTKAYEQVKLIVKALNEGWTPDWENSNQYKYYPYFEMGSPSGGGFSYYVCDFWVTLSFVGSRLCFKSSELAKYAGTQFEDIYKEFLTLNN